jgi:hypothetical protein
MSKRWIKAAATSQTIDIFVLDSSSTVGAGLTGLVFNTAGLTCYYRKGAIAAPAAVTLATLASVTTAWATGGFIAVDATNMPGVYRLDIPNIVIDTAGMVTMYLRGATNMAPVVLELEVVAVDIYDTVRLGLTAIPNIAQGTTGAISTGNASGQVTVVTNNDKTSYSLSGTQTFNVTGNITGSLSGSVGSVSGAVGSVTGSVGSVTGAVGSVTGAVGSVASGGITAASIATDAIGSAQLATTAVTEISDGLLLRSFATAGAANNIAITSIIASVFQAVNTLVVDDQVAFIGTAPSSYVLGNTYWVISTGLTATTFQLSTTQGGLGNATSSTGAFTAVKITGRDMLSALRYLRNKVAISGSTMTVYQEDDTAAAWTAALTATAGVNPITTVDPT